MPERLTGVVWVALPNGHLGLLVVRVGPGLRAALALGCALAAISLVVTADAAPTVGAGASPPGAAAGVTSVDGRLDLALLAPGRQTQPGVWSQRRLPTHPSGLVALLVAAMLSLALVRAGATRLYAATKLLSLAGGAGGPRGPPLLQLT